MKKIILIFTALIALVLTGCDLSRGTYYPDSEEMKANLEENGYTVSISDDFGEKSGLHLTAERGKDFIEFYWLDDGGNIQTYCDEMKERHPNFNYCISMAGDDTYRNIAYCVTTHGRADSGIRKNDQKTNER